MKILANKILIYLSETDARTCIVVTSTVFSVITPNIVEASLGVCSLVIHGHATVAGNILGLQWGHG